MANEKRLIDANALIAQFDNSFKSFVMARIIDEQPTVDAVEVVRCKDCKSCNLCYPEKQIDKEPTPGWYCMKHKSYRRPDDFCSYGERREGE